MLAKWAAVTALGVATGFAAGRHWPSSNNRPANGLSSPAAEIKAPSAGNLSHTTSPVTPEAMNPPGTGTRETLASVLEERDSRRRLKRFRRLMTDLKPGEFAGVYEQMTRKGHAIDWEELSLISEFLGDWAEHDPAQAFEKAKAYQIAQLRPHLAGQVLAVMAQRDPDAAFALLAKEPAGNQLQQMRAALIGTIAVTDLPRARALLREFPEVIRRGGGMTLFSKWAARDPLGAIDTAYQLGSASSQEAALQAIGSVWVQADPQAAESWINTLPAGKMRERLWFTLIEQKIQHDPQLAMESILRADVREPARLSAIQNTLVEWGGRDRDAALAFILKESNRTVNQGALPIIIGQWMESDAPGAFAWLKEHGAETGGPSLLEEMAKTAVRETPESALQLLDALPHGSTRSQLHQQAAHALAVQDLGAAQAEWAKMPPGTERDMYQQGLITGMAGQDPQRAIREVDSLPAGPMQEQLRQRLMVTLANDNPQVAIEWASRSPEKSQGALFGKVVTTWARSDPYAASAWLATLPEGTARDQAVNSFSGSVVRSDPEGAATWALSIQDEKLRMEAIRKIANQWKKSDEASAKKWIKGVDLPEQLKASLLP